MSYWALMVYRVFVLELPIGGALELTMAYKATCKSSYANILKLFNWVNFYQIYYVYDI